jgi:predicted RNase H-like HicB family nuclease
MQYMVIVEKGESSYGAFAPDLPGCIAVAETEQEVIELIKEAIEFHLEDLQTEGRPIPQPVSKSTLIEVAA